MAKTRLVTTNLIRMLDRISSPIYLIESNSVITYANTSCVEWLGIEATELNGRLCRYTSQPLDDPIENGIRGLAPPPALLLNSDEGDSIVSVFVDRNDQCEFRSAIAHQLCDEEGAVVGLLMVCSPSTRPTNETAKTPDLISKSDRVHTLLAELRNQLNEKYTLPSVLGLSSSTLAVKKKIDLAIQSSANVLIAGPSGSGREYLARTIDGRRRSDSSPPIPIHCAIADQELIQKQMKELSGAAKSRPLSEVDSDELLLLLDIDQLSDVGQAELIGFLSLPVFSSQIIATSRVSLVELARRGEYRLDLAELLSTIFIELRPLKERAGDLPILAQSILEEINAQQSKQLAGFEPTAMQMIQQFNWPQNIDQLKRCIISAANACSSTTITVEDLPESLRLANRAQEIGRPVETQIDLENYLQQVESELIIRAMQQAKGNKSKAAKLLGISRPKLLRRLQLLEGKSRPTAVDDEPDFVDSSAFEEAEEND